MRSRPWRWPVPCQAVCIPSPQCRVRSIQRCTSGCLGTWDGGGKKLPCLSSSVKAKPPRVQQVNSSASEASSWPSASHSKRPTLQVRPTSHQARNRKLQATSTSDSQVCLAWPRRDAKLHHNAFTGIFIVRFWPGQWLAGLHTPTDSSSTVPRQNGRQAGASADQVPPQGGRQQRQQQQ